MGTYPSDEQLEIEIRTLHAKVLVHSLQLPMQPLAVSTSTFNRNIRGVYLTIFHWHQSITRSLLPSKHRVLSMKQKAYVPNRELETVVKVWILKRTNVVANGGSSAQEK